MRSIGVTGGIGSGKSAFVRRLAEHEGVRAVYADDLAKRIMAEHPGVRAALVETFGPETYTAAGDLDRAHLAGRVFGDTEALAALNAVVHPAVRAALLEGMDEAQADGVRLFVYEAALVFETGGDEVLDTVVVVDAPVETRIARVQARDGATREAVLARMAHQIDPAEARRRADVVVANDGDLGELYAQADALAQRYA